jgi:hypothetical protein
MAGNTLSTLTSAVMRNQFHRAVHRVDRPGAIEHERDIRTAQHWVDGVSERGSVGPGGQSHAVFGEYRVDLVFEFFLIGA